MTDDHGVRDMLSFLLARDAMHQNQRIAEAQELRESGAEDLPVPSNFPLNKEKRDVAYQYLNCSDGKVAAEGSWASGLAPDGKGISRTWTVPPLPRPCHHFRARIHASMGPPRCPMWRRRPRAVFRTSSTRNNGRKLGAIARAVPGQLHTPCSGTLTTPGIDGHL
jgi:hypothetical protein